MSKIHAYDFMTDKTCCDRVITLNIRYMKISWFKSLMPGDQCQKCLLKIKEWAGGDR